MPFHFGERFSGQSKASAKEAFKYLNLLWSLRFGEGSLAVHRVRAGGGERLLVNSVIPVPGDRKSCIVYYLVSAGIATVASTLWNFGLTEAIVYRAGSMAQGRLKRLGLFFVVNVIALALRTPMIYLMTSLLGIYYVVSSNLVSLAF